MLAGEADGGDTATGDDCWETDASGEGEGDGSPATGSSTASDTNMNTEGDALDALDALELDTSKNGTRDSRRSRCCGLPEVIFGLVRAEHC